MAGLTRMQAIGWKEFRRNDVTEVKMLGNTDSVYEEGNGVVGVSPSFVQCLYEAQDAESCRNVFGHSSIKYCGQRCSTPFDAYAIGCCVSLCENDWNVDLSLNDLGAEMVEMLLCGLKSVESNGGFVKELHLSFNPIKHEGIKNLQKFPNQILENIKTLSISDCGLDQTGFNLLADTIPSLFRLESLDISLNPGGNGSTVKLLQALGKHQRVKCLGMKYTGIGMADVMALYNMIRPSGSLTKLAIGRYRMSPECAQQLVCTVLSPSSLTVLHVWVPSSLSLLDCIETISDSLTELTFQSEGDLTEHLPKESSGKGGITLGDILKKNTTLTKLVLRIPLENTDLRTIVGSFAHNHTLRSIGLPRTHASQLSVYPGVEQQVLRDRILWFWT